MAITKEKKVKLVKELKELINNANIIIVWEYLGLTANQQSELRTNIRNANGINKVFKNRLAKIAFEEVNKPEINKYLKGSSAFLFINSDEQHALTELNKVIKENDKLSFKGGYIEGEFYDAKAIAEIAALPGKQDLVAMLAQALQGTIKNLAYSLGQVAEQKDN